MEFKKISLTDTEIVLTGIVVNSETDEKSEAELSIAFETLDTLDTVEKIETHILNTFGLQVTATFLDSGSTVCIDDGIDESRNLYVHTNRDGSRTLVTGEAIAVWPEDEVE